MLAAAAAAEAGGAGAGSCGGGRGGAEAAQEWFAQASSQAGIAHVQWLSQSGALCALSDSSTTHETPPPAHRQGRGRPAQLAALQHQCTPARGDGQWQGLAVGCVHDGIAEEGPRRMHDPGCHAERDGQLSSPQPAHPLPRLTASSLWSMSSWSLWPVKGPTLSRNCASVAGQGRGWVV